MNRESLETPASAPLQSGSRIPLLALALLGCSVALLALASLRWPLSWDEGVFAWIGSVIREGGTPYVDAWDVKGPVTYFGYALAQSLFGPSAVGLRAFDLGLTALGAIALNRHVASVVGTRAAMVATCLLVLSLLGQGYNVAGQPDVWAAWMIASSVVLASRAQPTTVRLSVSGAAIGLATLIKPLYAPYLILPAIAVLSMANGSAARRWRSLFELAAGFILPIGATLWWFHSRGALPELVNGYIRFNIEDRSAGLVPSAPAYSVLLSYFRSQPHLLLAMPAAFLALMLPTIARGTRVLWGAWMTLAIGTVLAQGRWSPYQWAPLYPAVAIAAAVALSQAESPSVHRGQNREGTLGRAQPSLAGVLTLAIVLLSLVPVVHHVRRWAQVTTGRATLDAFERDFTEYPGGGSAVDVRQAAALVAQRTEPTERVFVWQDPLVNVMAGRKSVSRFTFWTPLVSRAARAPLTSFRRQYRKEFLDGLVNSPPVLILVDQAAWYDGDSTAFHSLPVQFPELAEWIGAQYSRTDSVGKYVVFTPRSMHPTNDRVRASESVPR